MRQVANPPNPWSATRVEWLDEEPPPGAHLEVYEEEAGAVLSENDSPDVRFRWSVNPYRGCFHACAYCLHGDTRVLLGDGGTRRIADLEVGDEVVGTTGRGTTRRVEASPALAVTSVAPTGRTLPLFDVSTGTGDFVANGVVSHNCYARPSHQYLGFGAGTDFDRKIVVKTNAPEALRASFLRPSWAGEKVVFSGNTDCYQPLEAHYRLTRRCLETCLEFRNPDSLITKGTLVRRDVDVLSGLSREARASVALSIPFADEAVARRIEPYVGSPAKRFETMRILSDAGVRTALGIAPVIPGLSDAGIPDLLRRARDAGARHAFLVMLRLPGEVKEVFRERLEEAFPDRARKVWSQIRDVRGGRDSASAFGERGRGRGPRWDVIADLFRTHCARLGLDREDAGEGEDAPEPPTTFRRPTGPMLFPM